MGRAASQATSGLGLGTAPGLAAEAASWAAGAGLAAAARTDREHTDRRTGMAAVCSQEHPNDAAAPERACLLAANRSRQATSATGRTWQPEGSRTNTGWAMDSLAAPCCRP